jgi:2-polyprenyl-6-methoxyphenol hydroxylase-like FAD-dependent oxidoreductase
MLDIHEHNGQLALGAADWMDEFHGIVLHGRQSIRVLDPTGSVLYEKLDDGTGVRPEAQRGELRQILLDALPAGTVHWGHKVSATRPAGRDRHEVAFTDGRTVGTSLLVGADGAWSRVRDHPHLRDAPPDAAVVRRDRLHRRHGRGRADRPRVRRLGTRAHRPDHRRRRPADPAPHLHPADRAPLGTAPGSDRDRPDEDATEKLIDAFKGFDRT